jgi:Sulfotransferase family
MDDTLTHDIAQGSVVGAPPRWSLGFDSDKLADPLFILAPPRSFSSVVCAMVGQHPQMYGLPETHLFSDETIERWWRRSSQSHYPMADGLLRAVAQLCFKEQTENSVKLAVGWLRRRSSSTSGMIFEELALKMCPSILVDKSPSIVYSLDSMRRAYGFFPQARFIHLVRHPRGHGESVLKYFHELAKLGPLAQWVTDLASFPYSSRSEEADPESSSEVDPQRGWYVLNTNIVTFLKSIPSDQWMTMRGEDLLTDPDRGLQRIASWMDLRADNEAIEEMKHPENSPYAGFGPSGARFGNDIFFLENPALHPARVAVQSLEGPLSWRTDGRGFLPEVKDLARHFGYQ